MAKPVSTAQPSDTALHGLPDHGSGDDSPEPKIAVRDLVKQFDVQGRTVTALDDLTLDIPRGQFFMIVGPSGCGKTTLLRILGGLESPTGGSVHIQPDTGGRPENSMIFQGDSIFPWMTVWDNASYGLRMRGAPTSEVRDTVGHYLDKTGLTAFSDSYPYQLSGGMRQRVSIARAFANDPDVLLMDEPFSALDEQNKTLLQEELLRIWDETRKTVVFITHSVDEAVTLGDRLMVMTANPGQLKASVDVPFERPRDVLELRHRPNYGEIIYEVWQHLREEVSKSQAGQASATPPRRRFLRRARTTNA